jgi:hypothetical protein
MENMEEIRINENGRSTIKSGNSFFQNENEIRSEHTASYPAFNKIFISYLENPNNDKNNYNKITQEKDYQEVNLDETQLNIKYNLPRGIDEIKRDKIQQSENSEPMKLEDKNHESKGIKNNCFSINEKETVHDLLSSHKLYEVLFWNEEGEKTIKCYRRYDNFDKLNNKLRKKYPFLIIPKLTPKHAIAKLIPVVEDFYKIRERQLTSYINYIFQHSDLSSTKEFIKFLNDAEFDEEYFNIEEAPQNCFTNESFKISPHTFTNKIYGIFSNFIFSQKEEMRNISEKEDKLRKMKAFYCEMLEKQKEIKINLSQYLKTLKLKSEGYRNISNTCFYLKDTMENNQHAKSCFKSFHEICLDISSVNKKHYEITAHSLEDKYEVRLI